ncbi:hypothetical protein [Rubritalea tangerina]|uniref:hypothetical protein n=1 Tax=Rubritalea tangerina TaxID=430798 RepID=UPI00361DC1C9
MKLRCLLEIPVSVEDFCIRQRIRCYLSRCYRIFRPNITKVPSQPNRYEVC